MNPRSLPVDRDHEANARQAVSEIVSATADSATAVTGSLSVIVEPRLTGSDAGFLIANPARSDGPAHAFPKGRARRASRRASGWPGLAWRMIWPADARFGAWPGQFGNHGA